MTDTSPDSVAVRLEWRGPYPTIVAANQFFLQVQSGADGMPDGFVLSVGHVVGPMILGTAEEQSQYVAAQGGLSVECLARFAITDTNLAALQDLLGRVRAEIAAGSAARSGLQ